MKLPFSGRKNKSSSPRKRSSSGVPESAIARPRREGNHWANNWQHPEPDEGMPGICGYLNGVKEGQPGRHPSRFRYVRPDGQPDDGPRVSDSVPSVPSTRPVPRGFFGP